MKQIYYIRQPCIVNGKTRQINEPVELSHQQALFLSYGGLIGLEHLEPVQTKTEAPQPKSTRSKKKVKDELFSEDK